MRLLVTFIFLFIDLFFNLAFAQSANNDPLFSFAPPASDASLVYLADLFGVVDGVLAGTGSQLFGHMMGVFNTAVLAFSSVITTYVLILGTVNTAHEGEFLGKQWSSIMLPLRILMGMALLVPKLSGYCLAQIMFMWVVVQGVGAADKIWNAALSYLNQGGQLVSEQLSTKKIAQDNDKSPQMDNVYVGAGKMLAGIVCMYGLQQWIMNLHTNYCQNNTSDFCKTDPPNFLSSIDAVGYAGTKTETQYLPMPNLTDGSIWANLNGKCGSISWVPINTDFSGIVGGNNSGAKTENNTIAKATRNIAVQTMYTFLTNVGMAIINNDPVFNTNVQYSSSDTRSKAASYAKLEFGVVLDDQRQICTKQDDKCNTWGGVSSASTVLFTGNEFLNAILAYYGVMQPYFSLVQQQNDAKRQAAAQESRKFIAEAQNVGWMYAGAYFFKLINLSNSNVLSLPEGAGMIHDIDAHLDKSTDSTDTKFLTEIDCDKPQPTPKGSICWILSPSQSGSLEGKKALVNLQRLISGSAVPDFDSNNNSCTVPLLFNNGYFDPNSGKMYILPEGKFNDIPCSSTVYGFIGNSAFLNIAGASTSDPSDITFTPPGFTFRGANLTIHNQDCSWWNIPCGFGNILISLLNLVTSLLNVLVATVMNAVIDLVIIAPMKLFLFPMIQSGMKTLTTTTLNPVVKLANMGAYFIQKSIECYFGLAAIGFLTAMPLPYWASVAVAIGMILTIGLPVITTWMAYFISVGITTAYYVPLVPYMIFLFGVIGWFFSVIESMIAAPLVALIITSPEGEGLIGKGETGIMILMNVFLRPSLMVIGFVSAILMSTISVWILTATFKEAAGYLLVKNENDKTVGCQLANQFNDIANLPGADTSDDPCKPAASAGYGGLDWQQYPYASILGSMFYIVTFISVYVTLTQKAFSLIHNVPDKLMRWIGGQNESYGQETNEWINETKNAITEAGKTATKGISEGAGEVGSKAKELRKAVKKEGDDKDGAVEGGP